MARNSGGMVVEQVEMRTASAARIGRALRTPRALTIGALGLAMLMRVWLIARSHGMMDGDEASLGIEAENILRGQFPVYFPGQNYMGAWDAYLMAPLIRIFGPSALIVRAVTLGEFLLYLALIGAVAARLYGERARVAALLLSAAPPVYVAVTELRMLGGYIETLTLGAALTLVTLRISQRWRAGRPTRWLWALAGALIGLGLWIDTLTLLYALACALWLAPDALRRARRAATSSGGATFSGLAGALPSAAAALIAGALTASPALLSPQTYQGGNPALPFGTALSGPATHALSPGVWALRLQTLEYFFLHSLPEVVGASYPYPPLATWTLPTLVMGALTGEALVIAVVITWRATRWSLAHPIATWPDTRDAERWNAAFPLILGGVVVGAYLGLKLLVPPAAFTDEARYILPLTTALTLALACAIAWLSHAPDQRAARPTSDAPSRPRAFRGKVSAVILLAVTLTFYAAPYLASDPIIAFDSPYYLTGLDQASALPSDANVSDAFPAQDSAMLAYLEASHIRYAWANHWVGDVVTYLTGQRTQCADYVNVNIYRGFNRFPGVYNAVARADRPSFIIAWSGSAPSPLALALDRLGVRYRSARFGRFWVITPLSRTVAPAEVAQALAQVYW